MIDKIEKIFGYAFWTFIVYLFAISCYGVGEKQGSFWVGLFGWWLFAIPIEWLINRNNPDPKP